MSETAANDSLTTLWNMAAPLRVLLIENSDADAELNIYSGPDFANRRHP